MRLFVDAFFLLSIFFSTMLVPIRGECALSEETTEVPLYGIYEKTFQHNKFYKNAYRDVVAEALIKTPSNNLVRVALFWYGDGSWVVRFSPDEVGLFEYSIKSNDDNLSGQKGSFRVVRSTLKGGIKVHSKNQHHFEYQDGTPFYFIGDTEWSLFTDNMEEDHTRMSVIKYIERRSQQHFNVVTAQLMHQFGWNNVGGPPFNDFKQEIINTKYWEEVDWRIRFLTDHGITAGLLLSWASNPGGYDYSQFKQMDAIERYAKYIASRYSAYNVYFIVAGEFDEAQYDYGKVGKAIRAGDPHKRMIGIHGTSSTKSFANRDWCDFADYQQMYEDLYRKIIEVKNINKPAVNSEYAYYLRDMNGDGHIDKPNSGSIDDIRKSSWQIAMAGGYFVTGFGTTYLGGGRNPGAFRVDEEKNADWENQVQHIRKIFSQFEWWKLLPYNEILMAPHRKQYVLAERDKHYLIYTEGQEKSIKVKLSIPSSTKLKIVRLNPRNSEAEEVTALSDGKVIEIVVPNSFDWLYLIEHVPA